MNLQQRVQSLRRLAEARIPANPADPENLRKADKIERDMRSYFKALGIAFPYDAIEALYYKYAEVEEE